MGQPTIIYYNGGNDIIRTLEPVETEKKNGYTDEEFAEIIERMKKKGQTGYLEGYWLTGHYREGFAENRVYCFFTQKPSKEEIERRKNNGFLGKLEKEKVGYRTVEVPPTWHDI